MFKIKNVHNGKNKFNIYIHELSYDDLDKEITIMILSKQILDYLFTGRFDSLFSYANMLQRFIPEQFINNEEEWLENWKEAKKIIKELMDSNHGFYSFFAEALMAYLNYKYIDTKLLSAVLSINDTLSDQRTGADNCLISNDYIILGEAKFYKNFNEGKRKIMSDFESNSLLNKINNLYRSYLNYDVCIKEINSIAHKMTIKEFLRKKIMLTGFILHNTRAKYKYDDIDKIKVLESVGDRLIVFYHLPVKSKEELVYKVIKVAMELIVNESRRQRFDTL